MLSITSAKKIQIKTKDFIKRAAYDFDISQLLTDYHNKLL